MPKTYLKPPANVITLINDMMRRHHPDLTSVGVRVTALMVMPHEKADGRISGPAITLRGYACAATIQVTSLLDRVLGIGDALMLIDGYRWPDWSEAYRAAVIDHELTHLAVKWEREPQDTNAAGELVGGVAEYDDHQRPKLKTRLHDWEHGGFAEIVQRHGAAAGEMKNINHMIEQHGQFLLPFMGQPSVVGKIERMAS